MPTHFNLEGNIITRVTRPEGLNEDVVTALNHISSLDGSPLEVDIVNMSFGNKCMIPSLDEKLHALSKNKVLIAAAGIVKDIQDPSSGCMMNPLASALH